MPKFPRGHSGKVLPENLLSGLLARTGGMASRTAEELYAIADKLEAQIESPHSSDHPKWLKRWVGKCRWTAAKKEKAKDQRQIYRAMAQLERLQRMRRGETVPAPLSVDIADRG